MKTNLFLSMILAGLLTLNSFAQNYELWGLAAPGYIYKLDENGENKEVVHWLAGENSYPGANGSLVQAPNKKLYGLLGKPGTYNMGVIFEYDIAAQTDSFLFNFDGENGRNPGTNSLVLATNGKLYGMTPEGGVYNAGVIFEFDPSTYIFKKLFDFNDTLGKKPMGDLCQVENADSIIFYGLTSEGGDGNGGGGVMFKFNVTDSTYKVIKNFDCFHPYCKEFGRHPFGSVMQADNGKIYGLTFEGGTANDGVLFEYDPETGEFLKKADFTNNITGTRPKGSLIQATDGKLYGVTVYGGVPGNVSYGCVFSYDIAADTLAKRADFLQDIGAHPQGSLFQASNGKMYGTTYLGACSSGGVFCFNPENDTLYRTACNGYPKGNLIEIEAICIETSDSIAETACGSYLSPSGNYTWTTSGVYMDTIPNVCGGDSIIKINLTVKTVDVSVTQDGINLTADLAGAVYQWLDCDNGYAPLSGDTSQVFTASANGNYAVAVTQDNCTDTSACYSVTTVGIPGNSFGQEIKMYPNPASGDVTIEYGNLESIRISVFNITGRIVYSVKCATEIKTVIPAGSLKPGLYFVKVESDKQQKMIKLVKQ